MKFLIIRFSSIGDIVLTTPVVRCLKKQVVTAEVHYLTKTAFSKVVEANPFIDKIHYLQDNLDEVIESLRREDFDYVIDLHHNLRTQKVKRALNKKSFSFEKLNLQRIAAMCFPRNTASQRVLEKIGMQREGLLRHYAMKGGRLENLMVYSILKQEAEPAGPAL